MSMSSFRDRPRRRLGLLLWIGGMLGIVVFAVTTLPTLLALTLPQGAVLPMPVWALILLSIVQLGVLLTIAVWTGTALAPSVGLHAPAFEAAAAGRPARPALRKQLGPGLIGGLAGGLLLVLAGAVQPPGLAGVAFELPLAARVLYGGVTEELLLRWGFMTLLLWLAWRFLQRRPGPPRRGYAWSAIVASALLFGAAHLPYAASLTGALTLDVVSFVVLGNAVAGILFGFLFWRYGLEAAILAHAGAHVVAYASNLFGSGSV